MQNWNEFIIQLFGVFGTTFNDKAMPYYIDMLKSVCDLSDADEILRHIIYESDFERAPKVNRLKQYILDNHLGKGQRKKTSYVYEGEMCSKCGGTGMIPAEIEKFGIMYIFQYACNCSIGLRKFPNLTQYSEAFTEFQYPYVPSKEFPAYIYWFDYARSGIKIDPVKAHDYINMAQDAEELPF